ncbi:hypothetical protein BpHYR1_032800 [Brachionus plicatilis]|uniref:Uncharacterized protein n=1 Tax=Brachionus plicatilis TaxID=10195 RepID=A0A3M7P772_BRAPC|nr:hypothetical protein BpHYR1_032800 [Brachionus plicatilis]
MIVNKTFSSFRSWLTLDLFRIIDELSKEFMRLFANNSSIVSLMHLFNSLVITAIQLRAYFS